MFKRIWPLLVLIVLALGAVFWPRGYRPAISVSENCADAPKVPSRQPAPKSAATNTSDSRRDVAVVEPTPAATETSKDALRAKGRIVFRGVPGMEVLKDQDGFADDDFICVDVSFDDETDGTSKVFLLGAGLDGQIRTFIERASIPIADGALRAKGWAVSRPFCGSALQLLRWVEAKYIDDEVFIPIAPPTLKDDLLDFGEIVIENTAYLEEGEYYFCGQIVHTSGEPLRNFGELNIALPNYEESEDLQLDGDGRFLRIIQGFRANDQNWAIGFFQSKYDSEVALPGHTLHLKPQVNGRVLDFGRIVFDCALMQIEVNGWASDESRKELAGPEVKGLPVGNAVLKFKGYEEHEFTVNTTRDEPRAVLFLPPGPWNFTMTSKEFFACYKEANGSLLLSAGEVEVLKVSLSPDEFIVACLSTPDGSGITGAKFSVVYVSGDTVTRSADGCQIHPDGRTATLRIHKPPPGYVLELTGDAAGWEEEWVTVPPDAKIVEIELTTRDHVAEPPPVGQLNVFLKWPKELGVYDFGVRAWPHDGSRDNAVALNHSGNCLTAKLAPGSWDVAASVTRNSAHRGYLAETLSGPVTVTIEADKTTEVILPDIPSPPWASGATCYKAFLTCEGAPFSYEGEVMWGETRSRARLSYDDVIEQPPRPYSVMDGTTPVAIGLSPPEAPDPFAIYRHDFECRLEVRVTRAGKSVTEQVSVGANMDVDPQNATSFAGTGNYEHMASAKASDGKPALLWLPPGRAEVWVSGGGDKPNIVEITAGRRAVLEVEITSTVVALKWDDLYAERDGAPWLLMDAAGKVMYRVSADTGQLELKAGEYRLRPETADERPPEVAFTVSLDSPTLPVVIPFVAAMSNEGRLLLPYPEGLKPSASGYIFHFECFFSSLGTLAQAETFEQFLRPDCYSTFTNAGILIVGLPPGAGLILWAAIAACSEEDEDLPQARGWIMRPRKVVAADGLTNLTVNWDAGVVLGPQWPECKLMVTFTPVAPVDFGVSYKVYFDDLWLILPAGDYYLRFEIGIEDSVLIPVETRLSVHGEGRYFNLPSDVLAKLKEAGLYTPEPENDK